MIRAFCDTHALIWYIWADPQLSATAKAIFEEATRRQENVAISSISLVEVVYLIEKKRIDGKTLELIIDFLDLNEMLVEVKVDRSIIPALTSIDRTQVPDMPDRVIAASAVHLGVPLITKDRKIQASSVSTLW